MPEHDLALPRWIEQQAVQELAIRRDTIAARQQPEIWEVFGKRRVLDTDLSFPQQTLLLLYASTDPAVPAEDLVAWTEAANPRTYRRDVLGRLHSSRLVEYDRDEQIVAISPKGVTYVEENLLGDSNRLGVA